MPGCVWEDLDFEPVSLIQRDVGIAHLIRAYHELWGVIKKLFSYLKAFRAKVRVVARWKLVLTGRARGGGSDGPSWVNDVKGADPSGLLLIPSLVKDPGYALNPFVHLAVFIP